MTPLIRNTLILSGIWILITIVSWILPGCVTPDSRLARMEYLLNSTIYIMEGEFCDVDYEICKLKGAMQCKQRQEQCEIAAYTRYKQIQERK